MTRSLALILLLTSGASAQLVSFEPGDIIITEFFDGFHRIDPVTGAVTELPLPESTSDFLAIDGAGQLIVADDQDSFRRIDPATGATSGLAVTGVQFVSGFVVEPDSDSLLIAGSSSVDRFILSPPSTTTVATETFFSPAGIAQSSDGRVFITEFFDGLLELDPQSGGVTPITSIELESPDLITVRPAGDLIVRDSNNQLLEIDPDTGAVSVFSDDLPTFPTAIASEANGDILLTSTDGVFRFDAATGVRSTLAEGTFFNPLGIVVVPAVDDPALPGDFNGDQRVGPADYTVWRDNLGDDFGLNGAGDESGASAGLVDTADFELFVQAFGDSASFALANNDASVVPEPSTASLILAIILSTAARSRRSRSGNAACWVEQQIS